MEVNVDSMIKKPSCSRNYDDKLEIAIIKKPTPKLDILSCKLGCLKRRLMLVRVFALNFLALPHVCLLNIGGVTGGGGQPWPIHFFSGGGLVYAFISTLLPLYECI